MPGRWAGVAVALTGYLTASLAAPETLGGTVDRVAHAETVGVALQAQLGFVIGQTGNPLPDQGYIDAVTSRYLPPDPLFTGQPTFPGFDFEPLATPEQFCPITCLSPLPGPLPPLPPPLDPDGFPQPLTYGSSLITGAEVLSGAVRGPLLAGDTVAAFGYSQSASVTTLTANDLIAAAGTPGYPTLDELANLHIVTVGDPSNPVSGILERFQFPDGVGRFSLEPTMQHVPFLNIPLGMAPTPTEHIPNVVYTGEYDGWANFPQDPLNVLAVINALIGILTVHAFYPQYTDEQIASAVNIGSVGQSEYFMIPQNLPILQFMFNGGTAGQFFGDFFSPWLRLIIDWGYGNAGDPEVGGLHPIPGGQFIEGSPYQQAIGVAGGPWAQTPLGELYTGGAGTDFADSGIAGLFMKMDPLQMLAGVQNALIQSLIGPWADVAASATGDTLTPAAIDTINEITATLQFLTGYDLVNTVDQALLAVWDDATDAAGLGDLLGPDAVLTGPLIPGQPIIDVVGVGFDIFNFFGA